jgi:multiple sugar transport system substrate-binding protein
MFTMDPDSRDSSVHRISTYGLNRRNLVKSMLVAGGAVAFSGLGRTTQAVAQDKIRLVHWYHLYGEAGTEEAVRRYATEYTAANPSVEVEVVWQEGDYGAALSAALLTNEGPDVFEQNAPTLDQVVQGQIAPLDDLYTPEVKADFNKRNLEAGTIEGKIYWVKMIDDTGAIYYKKSLLEEAGIAAPATIDELIAATKALGSGRAKGLFVGNDAGISALGGPLVWSAGGTFLTPDNKPGFNTPRVAASFLKLKELNDTGALLQGFTTDYWDPSAFIQGATAMQWTGLWALPAIMEALGDDVAVVPWPKSDAEGKPSTFWGGWGECVNAKGKNIDAAKALVKWMWIDNTALQQDWSLSYGFHVPPRISAAAAAEPLKTPPASDFVKILSDYGVSTPPLWTGAMGTALTDALTNVVRNGADPASELATAEKTVQAELDRLLAT